MASEMERLRKAVDEMGKTVDEALEHIEGAEESGVGAVADEVEANTKKLRDAIDAHPEPPTPPQPTPQGRGQDTGRAQQPTPPGQPQSRAERVAERGRAQRESKP